MTSDNPLPIPSALLAFPLAYTLIRFWDYFYQYFYFDAPVFTEVVLWSIVFIVLCVVLYVTKYSMAIGRSFQFAAFYFIYYLYTLFPDERTLTIFAQYRNLLLSGFAVVFMVVGLLIMVSGVGRQVSSTIPGNTPQASSSLQTILASLGNQSQKPVEQLPPSHPLYGIQKLIPNMITGLILVIFSYAIAKMIYDVSMLLR